MSAAPVWDHNSIFEGGIRGEAHKAALLELEALTKTLVTRADALPEVSKEPQAWVKLALDLHNASDALNQVRITASCAESADVRDVDARQITGRCMAAYGQISRAWVPLQHLLNRSSDADFATLMALPAAAPLAAQAQWMRDQRRTSLSEPEDRLATDLANDGLHGWGRLYDRVAGSLQVPLSDGRVLSPSRAANLTGHADGTQRTLAHQGLNQAWGTVDEDCAAALSHIVGTRQVINDRRGVDCVHDSLAANRMSRATLDAMLESARQAGPLLERYLHLKAQWLGKPQLGYEDLSAPIGQASTLDWEHARSFILEHFAGWNDDLAQLATTALDNQWVEAEDRDHKRAGGYCAPLSSPAGHSRIFMTFGNTFRSTTTLAHELGHAYHNWCLRDAHPAQQRVTSTLAETASVFAETLVRDAALNAATTDAAKVAMLDARLSAGANFLMNLPFRYELERSMYDMRRRGPLTPDGLREVSLTLQKSAYRDALGGWYPNFWASKLHFYISHFAFYNYPYTFGYLFSSLVYNHAKAHDGDFHDRYVALLQRTGWDAAEPIARDMLGLDLTDPDVWSQGWSSLRDDLAAFEALTPS